MSLNFSIDSILRHSNVESTNSTLISSGKLSQSNFLDESTSAFLKKQLNSHPQLNSYLTSNGTTANGLTGQLNEPTSQSLLQSPLFYLNKAATNSAALNLMDNVQTNLNGSTSNCSSAFAFELGQLNQLNQLTHLNPIELSRLNQLTQFQNQLNQFQSQLVVPYLSKINSLYNETGTLRGGSNGNGSTSNENHSLNSNGRPNSNQQYSNHSHHSNNHHHHHKSTAENSTPTSKQHAALLSLANGSGLFSSHSGFNTAESQCSPLSDKSCEMLLNYEDSSDSNRMSQHSGNNVSINSNNSTSNQTGKQLNSLNSSNNNSFNNKDKDKEAPLCTKCKLHGIRNQVKGHKKSCPKKDCMCELCILTDYGKRLRGKKSKKSSAAALAKTATSLTQANLLMMDSLSEASANNLTNPNNLSNLDSTLLTGSTVASLHHQSTTPNSNSNSSCSNLSVTMSSALAAAASLRNQQHPPSQSTVTSTPSSTNSSMLTQQLSCLHSGLGFLEKSAIKDYMKIVISLLKEKLAQDGLNYDQELNKLKYAVIYLLLNRFDKSELINKFITDNA